MSPVRPGMKTTVKILAALAILTTTTVLAQTTNEVTVPAQRKHTTDITRLFHEGHGALPNQQSDPTLEGLTPRP